MAIIKFSTADILKGKILEEGWRSFQITAVNGPTINDKKDGVNYTVIFTLIDAGADLDGKEFPRTFSSKAIGMMIPLVAAIRGVPTSSIKPEAFELDTSELLGNKVDGFVKVDTYEGRMNNKVEEYLPYKSSAASKPAWVG